MASSLATHQFAGVSAQFKCARARRRRGDIRDNPLPLESAATRAIFLPEGPTGTRAARPRAASPRARDSRDEWLTMPTPLFRRSAVARKNVKAARNVQVRDQTGKNPRAHGTARMLNADGSRLARRERALAGHATVRRAPNFARRSRDTPRPRASTARIDRPPRAPPPRRPSRVSTSVRAPLALQRKNPTDNSPMLPPYVLFSILADPRGRCPTPPSLLAP